MKGNGKIEDRVASLEREVADLKTRLDGAQDKWPDCLFGGMEEFPEWEEISKEGKRIGNAQPDHAD